MAAGAAQLLPACSFSVDYTYSAISYIFRAYGQLLSCVLELVNSLQSDVNMTEFTFIVSASDTKTNDKII